MGPLVRIEPEGYLYTKVKLSDCEEIVEKTILNNEPIDRLAYKRNGEIYRKQEEIPFYKTRPASFLNTAATLMHFPSRNISASAVTPLLKRLCST